MKKKRMLSRLILLAMILQMLVPMNIALADASEVLNMSKTGAYDSATGTITWTVKLKPMEGDGTNISIEDVYSTNQQYINNSFMVDGAAVPSGLTHDAAGKKLTYVFTSDIPENTEKVITYKTTPTADAFEGENSASETVEFTSIATAKSGTTEKGTASAKLQFNWIQQSGTFDPDTFIVHWKVDVNAACTVTDSNGNSSMTNAAVLNPEITDTLSAGMKLVENSVKFDGLAVSVSNYSYDNTAKKITYSYAGTITGTKTLEFDTTLENPGTYLNKNEQTNFTNTTSLQWTGNPGGIPSCKADVGVGNSVITMTGTGMAAFSVDGVITWSTTINENMINMVTPKFEDILPTGLEYVAGSFRLDDYREDDSEFFGTLTADAGSVHYEFGKDLNDKHIIKFKTKVTDYKKLFSNSSSVVFNNTAKVISTSLVGGEQSATASKPFTSEVISKSVATGYDYSTRRIKWKIVVNKNKIPLTNTVISDTMPEGMKFVSETFDVVNESGAHVTSSVGSLKYVNAGDSDILTKDSFRYTFSSTADIKNYTITYETEMKDEYLKQNQFSAPKSFINTADITESNYASTVSSSANQTIKNPIIEKKSSYVKGADTIDWFVPINTAKCSWAEGLEITDDLQPELELDTNTVNLYYMNVNTNGTLTKSTPVPKTEYDVSYKDKKLTISIHGPITSTYQLEFTTDVLSDTVGIANSISLKGSSITVGSTSNKVAVNVNDVTSIFYGKQGKITISKVDSADGITGLSGAVFQLYDIKKIPILGKIGTTDANGKLVFDSLLLRTYYIGEITAPDGYVADKELKKVDIDVVTLNRDVTFCNQKALGDIEFQKQNESSKPLAGAEFTLYKKGSSTAIKTSISDASGKVIFVSIGTGDYEIKETKAPDGYQISTDIIAAKVEIENNDYNAKVTLSKNIIKDAKTAGTSDTTAPTLTAGTVSRTSDTAGTVKFTSNEVGQYYYAVVADGAGEPTIVTTGVGTSCTTSETTITNPTGLTAGAKDIYIKVKDAAGNVSNALKIDIAAYVAPSSSGGSGSSSSGSHSNGGSTTTATSGTGSVNVVVNGKTENVGTETKSTENGKSTVTVAVNKTIESKIKEAVKNNITGQQNVIQVLVADTKSEVVKVELTGEIVKQLETNTFKVSVKRDSVEYVIPAKELTISNVAKELGVKEQSLKDIKVEVKITKLEDSVVAKYNEIAKANGATIVFPPTAFEVVAKTTTAEGKTEDVKINKFSNYVERVMEIPAGVDPSKITTGIVFNADGTYSHVPTEVYQSNGKWYAKLNSLTNSNYSVLWNPVTVKSVEKHWAKAAVNDMASRLVIFNAETFEPNKAITRADFAEYIVRALGLYRQGEHQNKFTDVSATGDRTLAILIASEYGIVTGYSDGTFKGDNQITREEAMTMYQRAMKVTKLNGTDKSRYQSYTDYATVSGWATSYVKEVLSAHVFNGTTATTISPKASLTYAESAQAIKNLLVESKLINN